MKIDSSIILFLYLFILGLIVTIFLPEIDNIFGGVDNCLVCTKIHFNGYFTNWGISHFFAFMVAGYISPKNVYYIISTGILWEIIELYYEYTSKLNHEHYLCKKNILQCTTKISEDEFWQHYLGIKDCNVKLEWPNGGLLGSTSDIIVNTIGVYIGIYIHELIHNRIIDPWEI